MLYNTLNIALYLYRFICIDYLQLSTSGIYLKPIIPPRNSENAGVGKRWRPCGALCKTCTGLRKTW